MQTLSVLKSPKYVVWERVKNCAKGDYGGKHHFLLFQLGFLPNYRKLHLNTLSLLSYSSFESKMKWFSKTYTSHFHDSMHHILHYWYCNSAFTT